MDKINSILIGFRLKTLPAVLGPLFIASTIGINESVNILRIILVISIGICLQILVNLLNDIQDFNNGLDNDKRVGPIRASQLGNLSSYEMKWLIIIIFFVSLSLGFIAFLISNFLTIFIGLILFLLAYSYTGGPKPYGYNGLGELGVILVFGPMTVLGSLHIFNIDLTLNFLLISLIPGISASLIILINNIRDIQNDEIGGKNTIAVILGGKKSRYLYFLLIILIIILLLLVSYLFKNNYIYIAAILAYVIFPLDELGFSSLKMKSLLPKFDIKNSKKSSELNTTLIKTVAGHFILCITISAALLI